MREGGMSGTGRTQSMIIKELSERAASKSALLEREKNMLA